MSANVVELPNRKLRVVDPEGPVDRPWLLIHGVRTTFLVVILLVSVAYQVHVGNFLNTEIWLPVYAVLLGNFLLNSVYLFHFKRWGGRAPLNEFLFAADAAAITLLIYFTGTNQSLFLFLYLINLILGGLVFSKESAWLMAIWTSICFSGLLLVSPEVSGQSLYFSLAINNIAFAAVTYLSGRLGDQVVVVGARLQETQADLVELQNLNESIVTNVTTGIMVVSRTGFVQYANPAAESMLDARDFLQVKVQDVVPELNWPWLSIVETDLPAFERREVEIRRSAAQIRVLEVVATRFKDGEGKLKGWLLLFDDRTDQKQLEREMRQKEKLAAVGQLAAGIAHEIRNPLASISGSIQLMLSSPGGDVDETIKLMKIVDKEINRLNGLITEFLEYVRPEDAPRMPVNINSILREVVEAVQFNPKLRHDIERRLSLNSASEILGNRDKLKQAFLNFVINAHQAMEKTDGPVLEVQTHDQGDLVVLVIRDNGCGIRPENVGRIFEPFHTTKAGGTGLGLAVTHKILEAHKARVLVDSELGKGTRFLIEFPAHRDVHTEDLIPRIRDAKG